MNKRQKLVQQEFLNKEEAIIRRLKTIYGQALGEITEKIMDLELDVDGLQLKYDWLDDGDPNKEKVRSQIQSKIYQKQYREALQDQIEGILEKLHTSEYLTVADYLNECYSDSFIGSLFDLHGQDIPLMIPLDQTKVVRAVQLDSKISQGLYNRLGQDVDLLKKRITAQVSRSVANGSSYGETARQLDMQSRIGMNNAIRIARTEGHRIQTTAAMDVMEQAKEQGADVVKQWDAALDGRTRASHRAVDGEIREVDEKFSNGLNYPGDPAGGAKEVINCRCALLQRCRDFLDEEELEHLKERADFWGLDKAETFKDFKQKYLKTLEKDAQSSTIITGNVTDQFDRKTGTQTADEDLLAVNPNYSSGEYKWQNNCQRCVPTYEMRRRGYKVTAKPAPENLYEDALAENWALAWENRSRVWFRGTGKKQIEALMASWGDGARAEVCVYWKNGGAHVFVAEQRNGVTVFLDPQSGNPDCSGYFKNAHSGATNILRVDNNRPSDLLKECCENGGG